MQESIKIARSGKDRIGDAHALIRDMIDNLTRTCINCSHWQQKSDEIYICDKYKMKPPPRIIINGCEQHSDTIPF